MSDNKYNPVACEHKLPNGFSAWSFQSEEQSNLGGQNKVSIHVCMLCGEISIGGYRPSKDETHTNSFHEVFHICHPDAIDAIIKQANYYNEGAKWGRVGNGGAVWVKASDINIEYRKTYYAKWPSGTVIKSTGWFQESDGTFFWNEQGYIPVLKKEHHMLLILDETAPTVRPKEDAVLPADDAVQNWFEENIEKECSASSAIYKFRLWLGSLQNKNAAAGSGKEEAVIDPIEFHKWLVSEHWEEHSSGQYWYRSKDRHQWPPEQTCDETELVNLYKQSNK